MVLLAPVVQVDPLLSSPGSESACEAASRASDALRAAGCFYARGWLRGGSDEAAQAALDAAYGAGALLPELPAELKRRAHVAEVRHLGQRGGYKGLLEEPAYRPGELSQNEDWIFMRGGPEGPAWFPASELWPEQGAEARFRPALQALYQCFDDLATVLVGALDGAFGIDAARWQLRGRGPCMSMKHYPPIKEDAGGPGPRLVGISAHTDFESYVSVLHQSAPGLEVLVGDSWEASSPPPGCLLVIAGDVLENLTGGAVKSAVHRVGQVSHSRLAAQLFVNNFDPAMPFGEGGQTFGDYVKSHWTTATEDLSEALTQRPSERNDMEGGSKRPRIEGVLGAHLDEHGRTL
mmetsp:Transcript_68761/g.201366  ORF Transcript_68761/g.201366 Transcript_68761/m.201366 type:complete len:349 (+) Transcript_68761:80-1126(+)